MRASVLALVAAAVLLAGCGGSKKAAPANNEASKPANQVFSDAKAAATSATSGHVSGSLVSGTTPITLDLHTVRGKGATGSVTINGLQFNLVRVGDTEYIQGSDAFWRKYAGADLAQLLHGKWIKASITQRRLRPVTALTSLGGLFAQVSSHHSKLVNDGKTTYKGQQVVAVRDTSDNSRLYVAATGKPYPVALVGAKKGDSGTITFDDWNKHVSLSAPNGAIEIP
jgi:hypothetical protein